jgi:malic enzyme
MCSNLQQGNNMYIFPGIGLGAILSKAKHVTDAMVEQASIALSSSLNSDEIAADLVYPRLGRIRDISARIALGAYLFNVYTSNELSPRPVAVIRRAQADVSPFLLRCDRNSVLTIM